MSDKSWSTFQGLARVLESGKWPIAKTCRAIESCLDLNRDNLRGFFEHDFLLVLRHVYGFDGQGWLWTVTQGAAREDDVIALLDLLSPDGLLFRAMRAADCDNLVAFIFPVERLPTHTQMLMGLEAGREALATWPQYRGRLAVNSAGRCHLHVSVFTYYVLWMAYYVLRGTGRGGRRQRAGGGGGGGGGEGGGGARMGGANPLGGLNAQHLISNARKAVGSLTHRLHPGEYDIGGQPYLRLLRSYLHAFLPQQPQQLAARGAASPNFAAFGAAAAGVAYAGNGTSPRGRRSPGGGAGGAAGGFGGLGSGGPIGDRHTCAEALLGVICEFWLTDGDQPLPRAGPGSKTGAGSVLDVAGMRAVGYEPPGQMLLEALTLFVRHISVIDPEPVAMPSPSAGGGSGTAATMAAAAAHRVRPAQGHVSWLPLTRVMTPPAQHQGRVPSPPAKLGAAAAPACQAVACLLYRFLRRGLALWPTDSAQLTPMVSLWLTVVAPWRTPEVVHHLAAAAAAGGGGGLPADLTSLSAGAAGGGGGGGGVGVGGHPRGLREQLTHVSDMLHLMRGSGGGLGEHGGPAGGVGGAFTNEWQAHVLSHLPFYHLLLPLLADRLLERVAAAQDESALHDLHTALELLRDSPDLLQLLREVELDYNRYVCAPMVPTYTPTAAAASGLLPMGPPSSAATAAGGTAGGVGPMVLRRARRPEGRYADMLPWLQGQAALFEAYAAANCYGEAPAAPQHGPSFQLFTGGQASMAWRVREVLDEARRIFKPEVVDPVAALAQEVLPMRLVQDTPQSPRLGGRGSSGAGGNALQQERELAWGVLRRGRWQDLTYHGDPMLAPITTHEAAFLVRPLVSLSQAVNSALGLTGPAQEQQQQAGEEAVQQQQQQQRPQNVLQELLRWANRRSYRVNLRPMADRRMLVFVLVTAMALHYAWIVVGGVARFAYEFATIEIE